MSGLALIGSVFLVGCRSPESYRVEADDVVGQILDDAWMTSMGRTEEGFTIEPAADSLRRRLLLDQYLPLSTPASAGSGDDELIEQWPDADYFEQRAVGVSGFEYGQGNVPKFTLLEALHIAATNSRGISNTERISLSGRASARSRAASISQYLDRSAQLSAEHRFGCQ